MDDPHLCFLEDLKQISLFKQFLTFCVLKGELMIIEL